ncbi:hypothetical protein [Nonomuraea sp. NPDC049141]|uniref:hypothetical protein n=1 Tax=Nonomuraea sp. NPDC049141 TaxID=3155500 RepID=UPI0033C38916
MPESNDHTPDPVVHSDAEAAAELSDDVRQFITDMAAADPTLTAEQISEVLDAQTKEAVTPGAVQSVLLAAAVEVVE